MSASGVKSIMQAFKALVLVFWGLFGGLFILPAQVAAIGNDGGSTVEGVVVRVIEEKEIEIMETEQLYQKLELKLSTPDQKTVVVENGNQPLANIVKFEVGDKVLVNLTADPEGNEKYEIIDFVRRDGLIILSIIFGVLLVVVARWRGLTSLLGMVFTFLVVFLLVLPRIMAGDNPVFVAIIGSLIIIPVSFYLAHGLNKKTTVAIISSMLTLVVTTVLGSIFINLGHLTGLSSEEAGMLFLDQSSLNMKGVLLAGIVVGALGVLDDITISQAAIVDELARTAKLTKVKDLYLRSMVIGKDHITSMVNTLVLAYAGASLPLLLIFVNNPHPFGEIVNYEMIAEEIIRTLIGSIGLILAVPITTFIAAGWYKR